MTASTDRLAAVSLLVITLLQIPFFVARTSTTHTGMIALAPLQVVCGNLARVYPKFAAYGEKALLPGAWVSMALKPYVLCLHSHGLNGQCNREAAHLTDFQRLKRHANMPGLVSLMGQDFSAERPALTYGSAMIVLSSIFALVTPIKAAILGFLMLGWGVFSGGHQPLPPLVLTAFLVVYAGWGEYFGEDRGPRRPPQTQRRPQQQQPQPVQGSAPAARKRRA